MQALRRLADATDALPGNHNKGKMLLVEFAVDNVQQLKAHEHGQRKSPSGPWRYLATVCPASCF